MIVSLTGHVIDCPQSLSTGCTILLNIKVYLTRKAFEKADKATREENGTFWQEQKETTEEEAMRQRKEALGFLFGRFRQLDAHYLADESRSDRRQSPTVKRFTRRSETEWIGDNRREIPQTL